MQLPKIKLMDANNKIELTENDASNFEVKIYFEIKCELKN